MRLALHNLKKAKTQFISFAIMLVITAAIVNIALVLAFQTSQAYDARFAKLDTAEVNVLVPLVQDSDDLLDAIEAVEGVRMAERHEGVFVTATVRDFADSDFEMNTVFYNLDEARSLNLLEVSEGKAHAGRAIYVPEYIARLGGFSVGEDITYTMDGVDYAYVIAGTVSEMQYGNYGTGLIGAYLHEDEYRAFVKEEKGMEVAEYSMRIADARKPGEVKNAVMELFSEKEIALVNSGDCETAKQTRTMVAKLLIVIFLALAAIVFIVTLFLSNFRIRNSIEDEMTTMGVLKAIGYTGGNIITSEIVPYTLVGLCAALVGALASYAVIPAVAEVLAVQSGFSFTPGFDFGALCLTVLIPAALILLFTYRSARKIRRLEPINAIRGIVAEHAGKNHVPLADARVGVRPALVLKQIASSAGQNVLLFALSFGIMILLSFAGTLLYNVNIKPDNFMDTLSEECPSVIFTAPDGKVQELKHALEEDERVSQVLPYATVPVSCEDGSLKCFVCEDFSLVTNDICYEGTNPAQADEIAVGSALAAVYAIGDEIEIKNGNDAYRYTVSGYVQSVNNSGMVCELTRAGFENIGGHMPDVLNVYLDGTAADTFIEEWERAAAERILSSINYEQLVKSGQKLYAGVVSAVTAGVFVLSVLVVLLVMYIIITSMLTRRRQEFGIYKAIGWSSRQLIVQSALGFVPVIAVASVLSALCSLALMPAMNNVIFGMLGAMKNHFEVSLGFLLLFAALFTGVSFIISVMLARPIRRITAYSLLKE